MALILFSRESGQKRRVSISASVLLRVRIFLRQPSHHQTQLDSQFPQHPQTRLCRAIQSTPG